MGHFSEDALIKFNAMCANGVDFSEGETYDFARCVMPDGEIYGTEGQCKQGKPLGDKEEAPDKKSEKDKKTPNLAKLTQMFKLKTGKDMSPKQLVAAANRIGIPIPAGQSAEDVLQRMLPKGEKVVPVRSA